MDKLKNKEHTAKKFKRIYQYSDGEYLPDSSQPNVEKQFHITSTEYTPHNSTRYINVEIGENGRAVRKDKSSAKIECEKDLPELYNIREDCCGCTACYATCSVHAIIMRPCEEGFLYPVVDAEKCMRCYRCIKVCPIKKIKE